MSTSAHATTSFEHSPVPNGRLAMWWFLASELAIFGSVVASFVLVRARHAAEWLPLAQQTMTRIGFINTLILLTSSLTVALAHRDAHLGKLESARKFLGFTILLGFAFLGCKGYEYAHKIGEDILPSTNLFWGYYYFMTGLHGLHVLIGLAIMIGFWINYKSQAKRFELVGLYWHLVDIVWIFLFPLLYLGG